MHSKTAGNEERCRVALPELPVELILYIFTTACKSSHDLALQVSLVSKWVRQACLPYVFSTVIRRAGTTVAWGTSGMIPRRERGASHLLPPPGCGQYARNLWIESINMMSSLGELSIFAACPYLEDVALTAKSLRILYTSVSFDTSRVHSGQTNTPPASHVHSLTLLEHTYRYDWHFLDGVDQPFLSNITHLRLLDMQQSTYIPIKLLPCLTHLALPFLHLRTNRVGDVLRLPDDVLGKETLEMIVLTVNEQDWLYKPWQHRGLPLGARESNSPRERFRIVMQRAKEKDSRLSIVLSPFLGRTHCDEWAKSARGGESIWEIASRVGQDGSYADILPMIFPTTDLKFTV